MELILQLAAILFASKIAGDLSVRLGQPSVLGKLLIGIVLGPAVLGIVTHTEVLAQISQLGVILLMFIAGLETDLDELKATRYSSTAVGIFGIAVPFSLGFASGLMFNMTTFEALFLGVLLSATSVSISVQALKELGELKTKLGMTILGAAVIDDILVIIGLAVLMSFAGQDVALTMIIAKKIAFFAVTIFVGWKIVPWFLHRFAKLQVAESLISGGLLVCFVFAYFAELTGVAAIIGAYIAGVAISVTKHKHVMFEKIETISYSIFVPVFFTTIGAQVTFGGMKEMIVPIVVISIVALISKLAGATIGAKLTKFNWRESLAIGAAMVSRGEVALIIAAIGKTANLINDQWFSVIVIVVLFTTIVTPPMMKFILRSKV